MNLFIDDGKREPEVNIGVKLIPAGSGTQSIALIVTKDGHYFDTILKVSKNGVYSYQSPRLATIGFKIDKDDRIAQMDIDEKPIGE